MAKEGMLDVSSSRNDLIQEVEMKDTVSSAETNKRECRSRTRCGPLKIDNSDAIQGLMDWETCFLS